MSRFCSAVTASTTALKCTPSGSGLELHNHLWTGRGECAGLLERLRVIAIVGAGRGALVADKRDLIVVNECLDVGKSVKDNELVF